MSFQWLFLVPLKGGRWHIIPQLAVYTTYIPLMSFGLSNFSSLHSIPIDEMKSPFFHQLSLGCGAMFFLFFSQMSLLADHDMAEERWWFGMTI